MGETQIDGKGPQVGAKRRAWLQSSWWCSHELLGAARADAAMQPHLSDVGLNFGNFDAVVGLSRLLDHTGDFRSAMRTMFGENVAFPGRVRVQWTMRPGMRLALGLASVLTLLFCPCAGGVLELSGVFGGSFCFARSAAFSSSNAARRLLNSSIRANNVAIRASFSALDNEEESSGGVIHRLTHAASPDASKIHCQADLTHQPIIHRKAEKVAG